MRLASKELVHSGGFSLLAKALEVMRVRTPVRAWAYLIDEVPTIRTLLTVQVVRKAVNGKTH